MMSHFESESMPNIKSMLRSWCKIDHSARITLDLQGVAEALNYYY